MLVHVVAVSLERNHVPDELAGCATYASCAPLIGCVAIALPARLSIPVFAACHATVPPLADPASTPAVVVHAYTAVPSAEKCRPSSHGTPVHPPPAAVHVGDGLASASWCDAG